MVQTKLFSAFILAAVAIVPVVTLPVTVPPSNKVTQAQAAQVNRPRVSQLSPKSSVLPRGHKITPRQQVAITKRLNKLGLPADAKPIPGVVSWGE